MVPVGKDNWGIETYRNKLVKCISTIQAPLCWSKCWNGIGSLGNFMASIHKRIYNIWVQLFIYEPVRYSKDFWKGCVFLCCGFCAGLKVFIPRIPVYYYFVPCLFIGQKRNHSIWETVLIEDWFSTKQVKRAVLISIALFLKNMCIST